MTHGNLEELTKEELIRELRKLQEAERRFDSEPPAADSRRVVHDLHIHQVELEMQNRELREAQELLEESRSRYADLYDFAPVGYCTLDLDGKIQEINLAGAALLGAPRQALIDKSFSSVAAVSTQGRQLFQQHLRECAETESRVTTELTLAGKGGSTCVVQMVSEPVRGERGAVMAFRTTMSDTSALKRLETRLRFLATASETLASSLDYPTTLAAVARLAVPLVADLCIIDALDEDGSARRLEVVFADPKKQRELVEQVKQFVPQPGWQTPQSKVIASGEPMMLIEISDVLRERIAGSSEHADAMRAAGIQSMMVVPLCARDRTLGAMTFAAAESGRRYAVADLHLAEDLARRAAMAMDNARLHQQAQRAIRSREALLATVAHDLRNPLAVILLKSELMTRLPPGQERQLRARKAAETIHRAAQRMRRLISDLLDIASIEAGRLAIEKTRQAVPTLVNEAVEMQQALAAEKSQRLQVELPLGAGTEVLCDHERILQVFANLIGNAVKFTPAGRSIGVRAETHGDEVWFSVADPGPGLPHELLTHVFDRFSQARGTARMGTGLGLSIAKGIVEAHGGRIWVESTEGAGSTFFFALPLARPASRRSSSSAQVAALQAQEAHGQSTEAMAGPGVVLVVDDDEDIRDALGDMLQHDGYDVVTAANGAEALDYLHAAPPPCLIFLDVTMPVMDGWTFLAERNREPNLRAIPVVVVSCHRDTAERAAAAHAAECLEKPLGIDTLRAAMALAVHTAPSPRSPSI